ncbi:MAG TPA: hypothetical protein VJI97_00515 [Candidatus Nanoarchaeia archaeon]|nr:hypothetical protein [Candidatus Nanoarchaeia archaeon]
MKKYFAFAALFLILLLSSVLVSAQEIPDRILSNSEDWRDVYSVVLYGNLIGSTSGFLVSDRHATLILNSIPAGSNVLAVSSKKIPYVVGYKNLLQGKGYTADEWVFDNVNLELAKKLSTINNYIVIDDSYGYNAVAVAPYAVVTKSYVIFADKDNYRDVDSFLGTKKIGKLVIYGNVDREVKNALAKYNPETINKEGDRFLNNIEIVKKYQEIKHSKQAVLTNGEFIEQEIMSGSEPIVFIGTNNVPDAVKEYIQGSDIQVGVLIGNELVGTATTIRRQLGISVFVKFAQGARDPQGAISQVEALDMYYLPLYSIKLEVVSIKYNKATNKLEVTLKNPGEQAAYFIGSYGIDGPDGSKQTVGDIGAIFIDGGETKTMVYDVDAIAEGAISVDVFVIYGESKGSLEKEIRSRLDVQSVRVLDECDVTLSQDETMSFSKRSKYFGIEVENTGGVDCYVDAELIDVVVAGQKNNFAMEGGAQLVSAGSKKTLKVKVDSLEEEDLADNEKVKLRVYYGERENALVRVKEAVFQIVLEKIDYLFYSLIIIIILLLFLVVWKRRKKKKDENKPQV